MSQNVKIRHFMSRNVNIRYFLSRNVTIRAMSRKNGINYATSWLRILFCSDTHYHLSSPIVNREGHKYCLLSFSTKQHHKKSAKLPWHHNMKILFSQLSFSLFVWFNQDHNGEGNQRLHFISFLSFLLKALLIERCQLVHWIRELASRVLQYFRKKINF